MTGESIAPPAHAERLLGRAVASSPYADDITGDLHESFNAMARRRSLTLARWWYRVQVCALVVRFFAVRAKGDPSALVPDVRRAIAQVDAAQPIFDVMPMRQAIRDRTIGLRFVAGVMGTFAALALVLAVLGLYAVMSYLVAQRVREIGVRIALGATTTDVTRLALGQAARLTAIGVGIGFVLAVALGRVMEAGLLGIVSTDFVTPVATALLLAATTLASSYLPARRAAAVDPMVALRTE